MIDRIQTSLVWVVSYMLSILLLTALTIFGYVVDMFELPFDVWDSIKDSSNDIE